jgi:hypothetical protein
VTVCWWDKIANLVLCCVVLCCAVYVCSCPVCMALVDRFGQEVEAPAVPAIGSPGDFVALTLDCDDGTLAIAVNGSDPVLH